MDHPSVRVTLDHTGDPGGGTWNGLVEKKDSSGWDSVKNLPLGGFGNADQHALHDALIPLGRDDRIYWMKMYVAACTARIEMIATDIPCLTIPFAWMVVRQVNALVTDRRGNWDMARRAYGGPAIWQGKEPPHL